MRPRFRLCVPMSADEVVSRLASHLDEPGAPCFGRISREHGIVELHVCEDHRHFWSPMLGIVVNDQPQGSTVHVQVGPNPEVWTMFTLAYLLLVVAWLFSSVFGLVQWWLGERPWGLWIAGALVIGAAGMYGVSLLGQRLAAPQTAGLRRFVESALGVERAEESVSAALARRHTPRSRRQPRR